MYNLLSSCISPFVYPEIQSGGSTRYKVYVYSAENQTFTYNIPPGVHNHDIPCAVCLVCNRSVTKMFLCKIFFKFKQYTIFIIQLIQASTMQIK